MVAALTLPYSQRKAEGFITKLKLLKRSTCGRAKLDLLRGRILYATRCLPASCEGLLSMHQLLG